MSSDELTFWGRSELDLFKCAPSWAAVARLPWTGEFDTAAGPAVDSKRFDDIAKGLATGTSRRNVLKGIAGSVAGGALGMIGLNRAGAAAKVNICHHTSDPLNPIVYIRVSASSIPSHLAHGDTINVNLNNDVNNCGTCGHICPSDFCNSATCNAGVCGLHSIVTCTASDDCHVAGECNPDTGVCSNPLAAAGTSCNDGDACTENDMCDDTGICAGTVISGNDCTIDADCCTDGEICQDGTCSADQGNQACTTFTCQDGLNFCAERSSASPTNCYCFEVKETPGVGICLGNFYCDNQTPCPNGSSDCTGGEVCTVNTCCNTGPLCAPACPAAGTARISGSDIGSGPTAGGN